MYNTKEASLNEAPKKIEADAEAGGYVLQIRKIGNSVGLILPKVLLSRLKLNDGDKLHVVEQSGSSFRLVPHDPKFEKAMRVARKGMQIYRNALAELAK